MEKHQEEKVEGKEEAKMAHQEFQETQRLLEAVKPRTSSYRPS